VHSVAVAPNNSLIRLDLVFKGGITGCQRIGAARRFYQEKTIASVCLQPVDSSPFGSSTPSELEILRT